MPGKFFEMNRHKKFLFRILTPVSGMIGEKGLKTLLKNKVMLPLYHAVNDTPPPHLKHLYPVKSIDAFRKDMDEFLGIARPVPLHKIIEYAHNRRSFDTPVFHLTFDDGLREFYDIAAPVLLEKNIPATCFLNSAFIDNRILFYRFKCSILIEKLHRALQGSPEWKSYHHWIKKNHLKHNYYQNVLLSISFNNRQLIDELAEMSGINFDDYLAAEKPYLTSDQIKSLISKGFTFGAHSIDHPDYQYISEVDQLNQTVESLDWVCQRFNLAYRVFSFPYTDAYIQNSFFRKLQENKSTDLTFGCAGMKKDSWETNLQRIPVETYRESVPGILKKEILYNKLLGLIGKEIIARN